MKSTAKPLQTEYYTLLNGQITFNGNTVPVYDSVPSDATYPHIQIGERTNVDRSNKTNFGDEPTQSLWIVDRFEAQAGSRNSQYTIADEIHKIVRTRPNAFSLSGFKVITTTIDQELSSKEDTDTYTYWRYLIRYRHQIEQTS